MGHLERHVLTLDATVLLQQPGDRSDAARSRESPTLSEPQRRRRAHRGRWLGILPSILFAAGIVGVGLIGVPVLAGSSAYALSEAMGWEMKASREKSETHRAFYGVIAFSVIAGSLILYSPISPMKALFWSAVINGASLSTLMAAIILLASKRSVMGPYCSWSWSIVVLGWIATFVMWAWLLPSCSSSVNLRDQPHPSWRPRKRFRIR